MIKEISLVALRVLATHYEGHTPLFYTNIQDTVYVFLKKDSISLSGVTDIITLKTVLPIQPFDLKVIDNYNSLNYREKTKDFFPMIPFIDIKKNQKSLDDFGEQVNKKFGKIVKEYALTVITTLYKNLSITKELA